MASPRLKGSEERVVATEQGSRRQSGQHAGQQLQGSYHLPVPCQYGQLIGGGGDVGRGVVGGGDGVGFGVGRKGIRAERRVERTPACSATAVPAASATAIAATVTAASQLIQRILAARHRRVRLRSVRA